MNVEMSKEDAAMLIAALTRMGAKALNEEGFGEEEVEELCNSLKVQDHLENGTEWTLDFEGHCVRLVAEDHLIFPTNEHIVTLER
jgi:hypothetical protein